MTRKDEIINTLIKAKGFKSYLEIGVDNPNGCFNLIECENKTGVDPYDNDNLPHDWTAENKAQMIAEIKGNLFEQKSDAFFKSLDKDSKFDLIFIDGLHLEKQVLKDVENSLRHLSEGGYIILHDCLPNGEGETVVKPERNQGWMGTVYQAFAKLRREKTDLSLCTIDTDCGLGVIKRGSNIPYVCRDWGKDFSMSYEYYTTYKRKLMNIVNVERFLNQEGIKKKGCKGCGK